MDDDDVAAETALAETRAWLDRAVIGLNLCPFAKAPRRAGRVRFVWCQAETPAALVTVLQTEMRLLGAADPATIETTLLVHPRMLRDFLDYNDFLDIADAALEAEGFVGVLQIASFHPEYQFAGTDADDLGNASNRSPYPTLQLLREASVERAVARAGAGAGAMSADAIVDANLATFVALGAAGWAALQDDCRRDAGEAIGRVRAGGVSIRRNHD